MRIRRLGWAGVEIEAAGATAVVDLLEEFGPMARFVGEPQGELPAPEAAGRVDVALVTHLHFDHADPAAISRALAPDGLLLRPAPARGEGLETVALKLAEDGLAERGVGSRIMEPWQTVTVGPFELTAVPSADGFGDPQVGWVIAADGRRVVHYGDTLFHGSWWLARMRLGPFDAAFLPVNGPLVDLPHRQPPSPLPAAMDPRQAVAAAGLLEARAAIPIHYDTLHRAPVYEQVDDPAGAFEAAAEEAGVPARVLEPGTWLDLGVAQPAAAA
jgi:L-ascorbate metabolism protein UlaG (beta-lactamase superfamily)